MADKPGRPKGETQTRAALIEAAKMCFLHNSYERVSIRELARCAGVDAAMIRYYFDSKAGLFETMVRETIAPVASLFKHNLHNKSDSPEALMRAYYQIMEKTPMLPRLLFQALNQQSSGEAFNIVSDVIGEMLGHVDHWIKTLSNQQKLNPQLEPQWVRLSFISLMVFPLIAPKVILDELNLPLSQSMLETLLTHNIKVMGQGLFNESPDQCPDSGVQ